MRLRCCTGASRCSGDVTLVSRIAPAMLGGCISAFTALVGCGTDARCSGKSVSKTVRAQHCLVHGRSSLGGTFSTGRLGRIGRVCRVSRLLLRGRGVRSVGCHVKFVFLNIYLLLVLLFCLCAHCISKGVTIMRGGATRTTLRTRASGVTGRHLGSRVDRSVHAPLGIIINFTRLLVKGRRLSGRAGGRCKRVVRAGTRDLLGCIGDVLRLSHLRSNGVRCRSRRYSIVRLYDRILSGIGNHKRDAISIDLRASLGRRLTEASQE